MHKFLEIYNVDSLIFDLKISTLVTHALKNICAICSFLRLFVFKLRNCKRQRNGRTWKRTDKTHNAAYYDAHT